MGKLMTVKNTVLKIEQLNEILSMHAKWQKSAGTKGKKACLRYAILRHVDLRDANLSEADLSWAYLRGANLSGADLSSADLRLADLRQANLSKANLAGANLFRADLSRANLGNAIIIEAKLVETNLKGAKLNYANLSKSDLSGAKNIEYALTVESAIFTDAILDDNIKSHVDAALTAAYERKTPEFQAREAQRLREKEEEMAYRQRIISLRNKYGVFTTKRIVVERYWIGMSAEIAVDSLGNPYRVIRQVDAYGKHEEWHYSRNLILWFENGILTRWQESSNI